MVAFLPIVNEPGTAGVLAVRHRITLAFLLAPPGELQTPIWSMFVLQIPRP